MKNQKILITGGGGFIGSHLAERLSNENDITVLDDFSRRKNDVTRAKIDGNLTDPEFALKSIKGFDFVVHLAADPRANADSYQKNLAITSNVLEAMRTNAVRNVVFASSAIVYGDAPSPTSESYGPLQPTSLYAASKLMGESLISAYCASFGLRSWIFRFANVCGPRLAHGPIWDFANRLKQNPDELELLGDGTQERCYVHIDDTIDGIILGIDKLTSPVNLLNIGSHDAITVRRVGEIVAEEMGVKPKFTTTGSSWPGDVKKFQPDIMKVMRLGFAPKHNSEEAVRLTARSML